MGAFGEHEKKKEIDIENSANAFGGEGGRGGDGGDGGDVVLPIQNARIFQSNLNIIGNIAVNIAGNIINILTFTGGDNNASGGTSSANASNTNVAVINQTQTNKAGDGGNGGAGGNGGDAKGGEVEVKVGKPKKKKSH